MAVNQKRGNFKANSYQHRINHLIRAPKVRLIDSEGTNVGVVDTHEALKKAADADLDLVLISEKAEPPVAKILDYSKFLYEERKKQSSHKTKSAKSETKEFIFGPAIGEGDIQTRIERTKEFLEDGHRVKMTVRLKGRERAFPEIGIKKLEKITSELAEVAKTEEDKPKLKGNLITITFLRK